MDLSIPRHTEQESAAIFLGAIARQMGGVISISDMELAEIDPIKVTVFRTMDPAGAMIKYDE